MCKSIRKRKGLHFVFFFGQAVENIEEGKERIEERRKEEREWVREKREK